MSKTDTDDTGSGAESQSAYETFCAGHPLDYAMEGVSNISSRKRRKQETLQSPINDTYGTNVSRETANVVERLYSSIDAASLVEAVKKCGFNDLDSYDHLFTEGELDDLDGEPDLGAVMQKMDVKLRESLAPRDLDASKVSKKRHRESVYVPDLINMVGEGGSVYMAKTLSASAKVRMAHDLNDENQVVAVDDYEKWEALFGWDKLKSFPHGKNKIREELGDQLSDDVLDLVTGDSGGGDTQTKDTSSSSGRRTRTKPSDEVLNVARSSRHSKRFKQQSQDILEEFEEEGYIGSSYNPIEQLILFPSTTDLNMTDHWWVAGDRWPDGGYAAIANCNKGTFEYLNQREEVWHIEDYIEQSGDYEFVTNHGPVTMNTVEPDSLVLHVLEHEALQRIKEEPVFSHMPEKLPEYCNEELYNSPEFPHPDDMLYAPISLEDVFWLRPILNELADDVDRSDPLVISGDVSPRNLPHRQSVSSDYKLYARARLHDWDFDSTEMDQLDSASHYLKLDRGGYEVIQTLAMLHDAGMEPFSKTPKARW